MYDRARSAKPDPIWNQKLYFNAATILLIYQSDEVMPSHRMYNRRRKSASKEQQSMVIEYMIKHGDLSPANPTLRLTKTETQRNWMQLAIILNQVSGGTTRDWRKWVKYWVDLKHKIKVKALRRSDSGGLSLSDTEKKLLVFLSQQPDHGSQPTEGSPARREPDFTVDELQMQNEGVNQSDEDEFENEESYSDNQNDEDDKSAERKDVEILSDRQLVQKSHHVKIEPREELREYSKSPERKPEMVKPKKQLKKYCCTSKDKVFHKFLDWETMKLDYDKERISVDRLREKNKREKRIQEMELRKQEIEIKKRELEIKKHDLGLKKKRLELECMREKNERKRIETHEIIDKKRLELEERRMEIDLIREENERSRLALEARRLRVME